MMKCTYNNLRVRHFRVRPDGGGNERKDEPFPLRLAEWAPGAGNALIYIDTDTNIFYRRYERCRFFNSTNKTQL
jgi:hypothetical protein